MKVGDIKRVLIVGAGTMGQQIASVCAINGIEVSLNDMNSEALEKGREGICDLCRFFVKAGKISEEESTAAIARVALSDSLEEAARDVDLVSESVPEDPALKGKVFSRLNRCCPEHVLFTTNTSTLMPSMFAKDTGRPDRLAALHFHDVRISTIVDVMPHAGTSSETIDLVRDFAIRIGQTPIVMGRESPGYVFNFMLSNLFESALTLAANGVASVEDIDRSWMGVTHMPTGPFGIMDSVGLQTVWKITDFWARKLNHPQKMKNADFVKRYVEGNRLGVKSGEGFYRYPKPRYRDSDFLK
jgi:3-hydroxybutyryl-CoA dehydrogenase